MSASRLPANAVAHDPAHDHDSALPLYIVFPLGLAGMYFLANPWPLDHPLVQVFWTLFTATMFMCHTSLFHETAHQTLTRLRSVDVWIGRIFGTLMFTSYTVYRESHIRHHAYLNKPIDWELWPYSDPSASLWFRRVFVWLDLLLGFVLAPWIYGRLFFSRCSPLKSQTIRRTIALEYAGIAAFWCGLLYFVHSTDGWLVLLTVWVIPHWLAGVLQTARKLTEHLGMSSYDPLVGTRTVIGDNLVTRLFTFLNFDIFVHGPHHRHPRDGHRALEDRMDCYVSQNPEVPYPLFGSYRSALRDMLPWLIRNPGVGMNVGAPEPDNRTQAAGEPAPEFVSPDELTTAGSV